MGTQGNTSDQAGNVAINPNGGFVGIGTTSPARPLHVSSRDDTLIQVESVGVDKIVGLRHVNDARTWQLHVLGYNVDEFVISDGTSQPFRIEPRAPSHACESTRTAT